MTEEEYFRKNFPDSCYGNKPLSPHWDYFQYGVEFGEQESEKQIKELEQKLVQTENDLADYQFNYPTIKELQKENEELKKDKDYFSDSLDKQIEATLKLDKENAELKEKVNILDNCDRLGDVITEAYKDQLTKAKELLERLLITSCNSDVLNLLPNCSEVLRVRVEAERFLNSEVEK